MTNELRLLGDAISGDQTTQTEYLWGDLLEAIQVLISAPLNREAERMLLALLRFDGRLRLSQESEFPHSMAPEDMLKSLAAQALGKWTGYTHLIELQRVEATARSRALASIVRAVIRRLGTVTQSTKEPEMVVVATTPAQVVRPVIRQVETAKELTSEPEEVDTATASVTDWIVTSPLGRDQGMVFLPGRRDHKRYMPEEPKRPGRVHNYAGV